MHSPFRHPRSRLPALPPLAVAACALLVLAGGAMAASRRHVHLLKSEPAAHDSLAVPPTAVTLWFSESVELKVTRLKLTDAAGKATPLATPKLRDAGKNAPVVAAIQGALPPGRYSIGWSTASTDGHPEKGVIDFVVLGPR